MIRRHLVLAGVGLFGLLAITAALLPVLGPIAFVASATGAAAVTITHEVSQHDR